MRRLSGSFASCMDKERATMTTIPLDTSLDVGKRLANLRTWQAEWQNIDRQLEEQLIPIEGLTLLELQQGVHIANMQRRMAMTLVKEPLRSEERRVGKECRSRWSPYH